MSPHLPITRRRDRRGRDRRRTRPARRSCTCTRATPTTASPTSAPRPSRRSCRRIKQRQQCRDQHHHRRRADDERRGAPRARAHFKPEVASLNMGSMNFGLFPMLARFKEFKFDWERPYLEGSRRAHLQEHLPRHREHPDHLRRQRHALRDRVLRHRPPLHAAPLRRPRPGQAAVLHPVGVRHPRRHRPAPRRRGAHEAHRRPPVRRRVPVERARRRPQPAADRRPVAGDGRQRARRARGLAVDRPGPARREQRRSRCARCARSSRASASRSPAPTRRARCCSSRAATTSTSSVRRGARQAPPSPQGVAGERSASSSNANLSGATGRLYRKPWY